MRACLCPVCSHRCLLAACEPAWLPGLEPVPNPCLCSMLILPTSAHRQPGEPLKHVNHGLLSCSQASSGFPYTRHTGDPRLTVMKRQPPHPCSLAQPGPVSDQGKARLLRALLTGGGKAMWRGPRGVPASHKLPGRRSQAAELLS